MNFSPIVILDELKLGFKFYLFSESATLESPNSHTYPNSHILFWSHENLKNYQILHKNLVL